MFLAINRAVKILAALLALAALAFLYQQRHWFEPVLVMANILQHRSDGGTATDKEITGEVISVQSGDTLQVRTQSGPVYSTRLTGLVAPQHERFQSPKERERFQASRDFLSQLVLSNQVRVKLTYAGNSLSALGIVHVDSTNINVKLLESGMAELKRDYIKNLPVLDQYALIRAQQRAQAEKRGIWKDFPDPQHLSNAETTASR